MSRTRSAFHRVRDLALAAGLLLPGLTGLTATPAYADGPGAGAPWVVSLGDSYISGEAGRWAGNTNNGEPVIDALGPAAYFDNAGHTAEQIDRCHRSQSAEVYIGGGVNGENLACSGAMSATYSESDGRFKPGLDFYDDGAGKQGQALMLQNFAASHNVKMVAVAIGGNDFNFSSIVQSCVLDFLTSPTWLPNYCDDDSSVTANFTADKVAAVRSAVAGALRNVGTAMTKAGYAPSSYTVVVQDYPSPIPAGAGFRYSESGYTRQSVAGCGFWNKDADWANSSALATIDDTVHGAVGDSGLPNAVTMRLSSAFDGRRLCENTDGLLEEKGLSSWRSPGAVDQSEWINMIRTVTTIGSDYYIQESLHPNYWGQLALRNCLRQAYNGGAPHGGTCTRSGSGTNGNGEPTMSLS
ncbi:MAG: hypothetical protein ACRDP6_12580 [Actinoallomurus sp.]